MQTLATLARLFTDSIKHKFFYNRLSILTSTNLLHQLPSTDVVSHTFYFTYFPPSI